MLVDSQAAIEHQVNQVRARRNLTTIPFATAVKLQSLIEKAAESPDTTPSALAQLARAWSELEDRKRKIKGKADPKPIDVTLKRQRSRPKAPAAFVELPQPSSDYGSTSQPGDHKSGQSAA